MKIGLLFLLLLMNFHAQADGLYTGAWSYHYYKDEAERGGRHINSNQNLLAYEHNNYLVGYFKNSFGYDSVMLAKYFPLFESHDVALGLIAGIDYGYRWCGDNESNRKSAVVCPLFMPELRYTKHKLQPALLFFDLGAAIGLRWDI